MEQSPPKTGYRFRWSFVICGIVFFLGILGILSNVLKMNRTSSTIEALGSFWEVRDRNGRLRQITRLQDLQLWNYDRLTVPEKGEKGPTYQVFAFVAQREIESAFFEITFSTARGRTLVLRLAPKESHGILLAWRNDNGRLDPIAQDRDQDLLGPRGRPLAVRLGLGDRKISVMIDEQVVLQANESLETRGAFSLTTRKGPCKILSLNVAGQIEDSNGKNIPYSRTVQFSLFDPNSTWAMILGLLGKLGLVFLGLGLFLRTLCLGRPPLSRVASSTLFLLVPAGGYFSFGLLGPVPFISPLLLFLLVMGLIPALFTLRGHVRTPVHQGKIGFLLAAALSLSFVAAAAWTAGDYTVRYHQNALEKEQKAQKTKPSPDQVSEEAMDLGAHNAWTVNGKWRNMDLETKARLEKDAILEIRLRVSNADVAQGIALLLSADPRCESQFFLEHRYAFEPIGEGTGPLPAGELLEITIKTRGRIFEAFVNGKRIASAEERLFAEGGVVLLAVKGFARVEGLDIRSAAFQENEVSSLPDRLHGGAAPVVFFLVYGLLVALLLHNHPLRMLQSCAFGLVPAAAGFALATPFGSLDLGPAAWSFFIASILLLLYPLIHMRSLSWLKCPALLILIIAGNLFALSALRERAWPVDNETIFDLSLADWSGDRLEEDLVHLQHPLLRRCNSYIACHQFRDRSYTLRTDPGTTRILCLGTSSTYGFRVEIPYPFRLEKRLKAEGLDAEVMIGACPAATGTQVYYFFQNVLIDFSPDIVTLSLCCNDSYALTQVDEAAYLERVTGPGYRRSIFDRIGERLDIWRGAARLDKLMKQHRLLGAQADVEEGPDAPHARFEAMLRRYAVLAREHDIRLVLMKEPMSEGIARLWQKEFHAAIDRVGQEFGLPVVDPTPLLNARGGARLFIDHVHLNDEGDAVVVEALFPVIRELIE